jgi:hypothetical protein
MREKKLREIEKIANTIRERKRQGDPIWRC